MENIIGREDELALLSKIAKSGEAELLAVYGRRRVGKTFLIRNTFHKQLKFIENSKSKGSGSWIRFSTGASWKSWSGYAKELENKLNVFRDHTKTRKTLFLTMVTAYGVRNSKSYTGLIQCLQHTFFFFPRNIHLMSFTIYHANVKLNY